MKLGAIEAGGTKFVCAVGNELGEVFERISIPTTAPEITMSAVDQLFIKNEIEALGIGSFGPINIDLDSRTFGFITNTPKVLWQNYDFMGYLKQHLEVPMYWTTDVNEAAFGESQLGAAQNVNNSIYLTIGTGVGGGIINNNHIFNGRTHSELGHMRINRLPQDTFSSNCPFHDVCLEGFVSGPAIEKRTGLASKFLATDDPTWKIIADYIAQACVNLTVAFAPDKIILNGGVMHQIQLFEIVRSKFKNYFNNYEELPPLNSYICSAGLKEDSGIVGGLLLGKKALIKNNFQNV